MTGASKIFVILRRKMARTTDYIIVGAGLAGTTLAKELIGRGRSVVVIDNGARSSSMVAGGLMNPLTGKRLVYDESFAEKYRRAVRAYEDIPGALRTLPIVRVLSDDTEIRSWNKKESLFRSDYRITSTDHAEASRIVPLLNPAYKHSIAVLIPEAGHLQTAAVIEARKAWLREQDALVVSQADVHAWDPASHTLAGIDAGRVVLCEGWHLSTNSAFSRIPTMCAKGQLLTVHIPEHPTIDAICIHRGRFLVPLGDHLYRYGATYEWNDINEDVLPSTTEFLLEGLQDMVSCHVTVVRADAGIRPIIRDLAPVLGVHPDHPHVGIFNGMGSKGALLAPTLAPMLADHLENGDSIPPAYSLKRFSQTIHTNDTP